VSTRKLHSFAGYPPTPCNDQSEIPPWVQGPDADVISRNICAWIAVMWTAFTTPHPDENLVRTSDLGTLTCDRSHVAATAPRSLEEAFTWV
jgi:hypothetical protein